jgi:hypothetical protein
MLREPFTLNPLPAHPNALQFESFVLDVESKKPAPPHVSAVQLESNASEAVMLKPSPAHLAE